MIKFLVDSASDCNKDSPTIDYFMPVTINIDSKEYKSGIELDSDRFYELQATAKEFPKTSQPSPQDFVDVFEEVKEAGDELICFLISSALSGTCQGANIAKEMVDYDGIYIIDTLSATHLIGILAEYARELRENGLSADEIVEKCETLKSKIKVLAGVDTLEYLYKGGRMSRATAAVGSLANIKPILTVTPEGRVEAVGKAIGKGRAIQFIIDKIPLNELDENFPMYSIYSSGTENVTALEEKLEAEGISVKERLQIWPAIGAHTGPGVYGIIFVTK